MRRWSEQTARCFAVLLVAFLFWSLTAGGVGAATIRLERDGSGDFTVLQDALDAAAARDTIRIGPGRYDDFHLLPFRNGYLGAILGLVDVDSLVILGESADTVFIGPDQLMFDYQGQETFGLLEDDPQPLGWTLRGVTLENVDIVIKLTGPCTVSDCTFRGLSNISARISVRGIEGVKVAVRRCKFERSKDPYDLQNLELFGSAINDGPSILELSDCSFEQVGFNIESTDSVYVKNVSIVDGAAGFVYSNGLVDNLRVQNTRSAALFTDSSRLALTGSVFQGGRGAVTALLSTNSRIRCFHTRFLTPYIPPNAKATLDVTSATSFEAVDCEFHAGAPYALEAIADLVGGTEMDLRNNYWGTTDSLQIEGLILDAADKGTPDYPIGFDLARVRFWPVRDTPLATRRMSFGAFKVGQRP